MGKTGKQWIRAFLALLAAAVVWFGGMSAPAAFAQSAAPKVEIYTTAWCGYCKQAVGFLRSQRIPFTEYDVEKDPAAARRWQELSPGGGVPVAVIGDRVIRGYSREAYEQALREGR